MKIAIIWPAYPYRGGIAQGVNSFICSLINKGHIVGLFNFSKLYPKWLFPGKNQFESPDTPNPFEHISSFREIKIINTINPFSWFKTYLAIINSNASVCFMRYWHPFFVPCLYTISYLLRRKKVQVICIVDNLLPHERFPGDIFFVKAFFSQVDKVITQSDIVHRQFSSLFPNITEQMIPLPVYDQFWPPVSQIVARDYLKMPLSSKNMLLFFGFIRPYKWLDVLLTSLPIIRESIPDVTLYIVWECFGDFSSYQDIIDNLNVGGIITKHLYYIPSEDIKYWLGSCDLLVMPYKSVTNSAVNAVWLHYAKNSLLTVGLSSQELAEKIIFSLTYPSEEKIAPVTWENFTERVLNFV